MASVRRFFVHGSPASGEVIALGDAEARHARVLRLVPGDPVELFDGRGGSWDARVQVASKGRLAVVVGEERPPVLGMEPPLALTVAQGLARGARMDEVIRHGTELGVTRFAPVLFHRSTRREGNPDRWRAIARDAARQCGRSVVPVVADAVPFETFVGSPPPGWRGLLCPPGEGVVPLAGALPEQLDAAVLVIGPEGGLDPPEVAGARRAGFTGVSLGPRVLRTETAGLAAVAAILALRGDLG